MMATFWLTQLAMATLNILLVLLFVIANTEFCGSVFETQVGHVLVGHVVDNALVFDEFECHLKCLGNNSCKSFNVLHKDDNNAKLRICELNNETRETNPRDFKRKKGSTYYGSIQVSCIDVKSGTCHPGDKDKQSEAREEGSSPVCGTVGVADKKAIPDARMTASTFYSSHYYPYYGRLNESRGRGAWCAKSDRTEYLQVDMGALYSVCAVATHGNRQSSNWVTSYKLHLSTDGVTWNVYKENNFEKVFSGNTDQRSIVKRSLKTDIKARFVRFYPVTYHNHPCLAVDIFVLH